LPLKFFLQDYKNSDESFTLPSLVFVLRPRNSSANAKDTTLLFDLGVRKDIEKLPPRVHEFVNGCGGAVIVEKGVDESLKSGGIVPEGVNYIITSHAHWDHSGDPSLFPKAKFLVGAECRSLFQPGYPEDPTSGFPTGLYPEDRTTYLDTAGADWKELGPFPKALDLFGDDSLYLIDAPGHLPGHINILARTSEDGGWVYLGGDSAHHRRLLTGESEMATMVSPEGKVLCAHEHHGDALGTIERIKAILKYPRVQVLLAHDVPWYNENKANGLWPAKIPSL